MSVGGCASVVKVLLVIFNALFFMVGIAILGIGIWVKVERAEYEDISKFDYITVANIAIAVGIIMLVVAFFGFFGALIENSRLLLVHFIMLLLIFILEIVALALAYAKQDEVEEELRVDFKAAIREKYGVSNVTTDVIDKFQEKFECCGFDDFADYVHSAFNNKTGSLPKSCCRKEDRSSMLCGSSNNTAIEVYHTKGCFKEVKKFLDENLLLIGGFATGVAIIEFVGMAFTLYLYMNVKRDEKGTLA